MSKPEADLERRALLGDQKAQKAGIAPEWMLELFLEGYTLQPPEKF